MVLVPWYSKRTLISRGKSWFFTQCQQSKGENDTASDIYDYLNKNKHDWCSREGFNSLLDGNFLSFRIENIFQTIKWLLIKLWEYISNRVEKHCRRRRQCFFQAFSPLPAMFSKAFFLNSFTWHGNLRLFSNSAGNTDMMSKIWTNGDTIIRLSRKHCWKGRNCSLLRYIGYVFFFFSFFFFFFWRRVGSKINVGKGEIAFNEHEQFLLSHFVCWVFNI